MISLLQLESDQVQMNVIINKSTGWTGEGVEGEGGSGQWEEGICM